MPEDIWLGVERVADPLRLSRHNHDRPYLALVLRGGYVEAGDNGRVQVGCGDVLVHGRFDAHMNAFCRGGADILNLPCPPDVVGQVGRVADPDLVVRLAERDPYEATISVLAGIVPATGFGNDWPDLLARALDRDEVVSLAGWAEGAGIAATSLSRGFALAYGTSPQRFRADRRACRAAREIAEDARPLAQIALGLGFADQAHMSREVLRLTGLPPGRLRTEANCVQESARLNG